MSSDFLDRLVGRALGRGPYVRPSSKPAYSDDDLDIHLEHDPLEHATPPPSETVDGDHDRRRPRRPRPGASDAAAAPERDDDAPDGDAPSSPRTPHADEPPATNDGGRTSPSDTTADGEAPPPNDESAATPTDAMDDIVVDVEARRPRRRPTRTAVTTRPVPEPDAPPVAQAPRLQRSASSPPDTSDASQVARADEPAAPPAGDSGRSRPERVGRPGETPHAGRLEWTVHQGPQPPEQPPPVRLADTADGGRRSTRGADDSLPTTGGSGDSARQRPDQSGQIPDTVRGIADADPPTADAEKHTNGETDPPSIAGRQTTTTSDRRAPAGNAGGDIVVVDTSGDEESDDAPADDDGSTGHPGAGPPTRAAEPPRFDESATIRTATLDRAHEPSAGATDHPDDAAVAGATDPPPFQTVEEPTPVRPAELVEATGRPPPTSTTTVGDAAPSADPTTAETHGPGEEQQDIADDSPGEPGHAAHGPRRENRATLPSTAGPDAATDEGDADEGDTAGDRRPAPSDQLEQPRADDRAAPDQARPIAISDDLTPDQDRPTAIGDREPPADGAAPMLPHGATARGETRSETGREPPLQPSPERPATTSATAAPRRAPRPATTGSDPRLTSASETTATPSEPGRTRSSTDESATGDADIPGKTAAPASTVPAPRRPDRAPERSTRPRSTTPPLGLDDDRGGDTTPASDADDDAERRGRPSQPGPSEVRAPRVGSDEQTRPPADRPAVGQQLDAAATRRAQDTPAGTTRPDPRPAGAPRPGDEADADPEEPSEHERPPSAHIVPAPAATAGRPEADVAEPWSPPTNTGGPLPDEIIVESRTTGRRASAERWEDDRPEAPAASEPATPEHTDRSPTDTAAPRDTSRPSVDGVASDTAVDPASRAPLTDRRRAASEPTTLPPVTDRAAAPAPARPEPVAPSTDVRSPEGGPPTTAAPQSAPPPPAAPQLRPAPSAASPPSAAPTTGGVAPPASPAAAAPAGGPGPGPATPAAPPPGSDDTPAIRPPAAASRTTDPGRRPAPAADDGQPPDEPMTSAETSSAARGPSTLPTDTDRGGDRPGQPARDHAGHEPQPRVRPATTGRTTRSRSRQSRTGQAPAARADQVRGMAVGPTPPQRVRRASPAVQRSTVSARAATAVETPPRADADMADVAPPTRVRGDEALTMPTGDATRRSAPARRPSVTGDGPRSGAGAAVGAYRQAAKLPDGPGGTLPRSVSGRLPQRPIGTGRRTAAHQPGEPAAERPSPVQVHIGRIEVRTPPPAAPATEPASRGRQRARMSLDDYLARHRQ